MQHCCLQGEALSLPHTRSSVQLCYFSMVLRCISIMFECYFPSFLWTRWNMLASQETFQQSGRRCRTYLTLSAMLPCLFAFSTHKCEGKHLFKACYAFFHAALTFITLTLVWNEANTALPDLHAAALRTFLICPIFCRWTHLVKTDDDCEFLMLSQCLSLLPDLRKAASPF